MDRHMLEMTEISKSFGGVHALKKVDFSCEVGEVHCLAGENGAGKSTLLKMLAGLFAPDSGTISLNGEIVRFTGPWDAQKKGIGMVFQELTLVPDMTVLENIFLNIEPKKRFGIVDKRKMLEKLNALMDRYDIHIDTETVVKRMSVAQQQMTEILKLLLHDPSIIILDEPTSALARKEVEKLYAIMRAMTAQGKTVIFISHRMEEVFEISDRITVFKDGEKVGTRKIKEINEEDLIKMMVGRPLNNIFPHGNEIDESQVVFEAREIEVEGSVHGVSFQVKKGAVLGIAGLAGHGQTELLNSIAGVIPKKSGQVLINGTEVNTKKSWKAIEAGIAIVPEDRKTEGLMLALSVRKNLTVASLKKYTQGFSLSSKKEKGFVSDMIRKLSIKTASAELPVQSLSGGNQQKVALGKGLAINPKVLLFNEPTRGIDVEAKSEFYKIMRDLAREGVAVIITSSDLMEIVGMCDNIVVMYEGKVTGELGKQDITEENIMRYAVGLK